MHFERICDGSVDLGRSDARASRTQQIARSARKAARNVPMLRATDCKLRDSEDCCARARRGNPPGLGSYVACATGLTARRVPRMPCSNRSDRSRQTAPRFRPRRSKPVLPTGFRGRPCRIASRFSPEMGCLQSRVPGSVQGQGRVLHDISGSTFQLGEAQTHTANSLCCVATVAWPRTAQQGHGDARRSRPSAD